MARPAADKRVLTDATVKAAKVTAGRHDILDAVCPGLILRVSVTRKTWLRRADGKRIALGNYPSVSLAEARKACAEMHDMATKALTVEEAAERFIQAHAVHIRSGVQLEWILRKHVIPNIGDRAIASIGRSDVADLLRTVQGPDTTKRVRITNLVRAAMSGLLGWAVSEGKAASNPAADVKRRKGERKGERILSDEELRAIWLAAEDWHPFGTIVRLLILTAQRRDEIAGLVWPEVDLKARLLHLPARRMKANRDHTVPLSGLTVGTLFGEQRIDLTGPSSYLGAGPVFRSFTAWSKSKARLDRLSNVHDWKLNDLRRTTAGGMVRLGAPRDIADQVLGHAVHGAGSVYIRESDLVAMRDALDRWGEHVEKITAPRLPGLL